MSATPMSSFLAMETTRAPSVREEGRKEEKQERERGRERTDSCRSAYPVQPPYPSPDSEETLACGGGDQMSLARRTDCPNPPRLLTRTRAYILTSGSHRGNSTPLRTRCAQFCSESTPHFLWPQLSPPPMPQPLACRRTSRHLALSSHVCSCLSAVMCQPRLQLPVCVQIQREFVSELLRLFVAQRHSDRSKDLMLCKLLHKLAIALVVFPPQHRAH